VDRLDMPKALADAYEGRAARLASDPAHITSARLGCAQSRSRQSDLVRAGAEGVSVIEIVPRGNGFAWQMICAKGRVLAYALETFPCIISAEIAAKKYRSEFWAAAAAVDHRMGACI